MEALKNLIANVPDWLKKLDELNGQIEQRQIELAKLTEETKMASPNGDLSDGNRSVRNKGSTESLKPRDEPEAHPRDPTPQVDADNTAETAAAAAVAAAAGAAAAKASTEQPAPTSPSDSQSPSALQRQVSQMRAAGQARARATLRKRQRTDSVLSAEGATPKYRTRCMIIVYYDSYVQTFFEDLVKFVSAGRNMMRKAKMAAKVAQIRRLAELDMPDDDEDDDEEADGVTPAGDGPIPASPAAAKNAQEEGKKGEEQPPALKYVSTRRMGPAALMVRTSRNMYSRTGAARVTRGVGSPGLQPAGAVGGDVYDELDKGLEYVQSMCEHAAHQFLRDGDCAEEVANIKRRLAETKELADKEMERVRREEPEALRMSGEDDGMRGRSYRPQSMRKDGVKSTQCYPKEPTSASASPAAAVVVVAAAEQPLEVDEGVEDMDMDEMQIPKLVYKSTRMMR